jgi:ABC-2 type transport system permease protein
MKPLKVIATLLLRIVLISLALLLFFSMMAGMYYHNAPRHIKTAIVDNDHSPLSRSVIFAIRSSNYYDVKGTVTDYATLQDMLDQGTVDVGIVIPAFAYRDVLNGRHVRILFVADGTANPIIPNMAMMMLNKIIMTLNNQLAMHLRVEDLGTIPNVRHPKKPLLQVSSRVFYNPVLSMEKSMLPAFMGLAMQIVSMLIVLFALMASLSVARRRLPYISQARQLPVKVLLPPFIISWIIVTTGISSGFFGTMYLFDVPFTQETVWKVVALIGLFVLAMESMSYFLSLNINNGAVLAGIITLIVMPAFMYSGYLIPEEQLAHWPNMIGSWFPLRYYLHALFPVFNHHQPLAVVSRYTYILWEFVILFLILSLVSIVIGRFERVSRRKRAIREEKVLIRKRLQERSSG